MHPRPTRRSDPRETLVSELEGLIRDHRAGRDVLNMLANGSEGPVRLSRVLSLALHGPDVLPAGGAGSPTWFPDCAGIPCDSREHATLEAIGAGRSENGAARVVSAALAWLERDRPRFLKWASRALQSLPPRRDNPVATRGLFGAERWDVPVGGEWFGPLAAAAQELESIRPVLTRRFGGHVAPGDILRAMLAEWDRPAFRALIVAERSAAA